VEVEGRIVDTLNKPLSSTIIEIIFLGHTKFTVTNSQGYFKQNICYNNDSIFKAPLKLTSKIIGYYDSDTSFIPQRNTINVGNIIKKLSVTTLSEVIVKNLPIIQKGDTTSFFVGSFKNKLDINLEDVLKKMPGFDIDANGAILYNNKPIEDVLIEGDQLAKNYKLISKNINPEMIDKVEVIDKYNSNPVLRDLSNSRKQAMNLKLKNSNRINVFGEIKAGIGVVSKYGITSNLFAIMAKIKSLIILNANNIGQSPYDEVTTTDKSVENREYESDYTIIPSYVTENKLFTKSEFSTNSSLANNTLLNSSKMAVVNNSIKLTSKITLKIFTDAYKDSIKQNQITKVINNFTTQYSYSDFVDKKFIPFNSNSNFQFKYLSKRIQALLGGSVIFKDYREIDTITSNISYQAKLNSKFKRLGFNSFFTYRLDSAKAFEMGLQYSSDNKSQFYNILQNAERIFDTISTNGQMQETENEIDYIKGELKYLFKSKTHTTNILSLSNTYYTSAFKSFLNISTPAGVNLYPTAFQNSIVTSSNRLLLNYNSGFKMHRFNFIINLGLLYANSFNRNETTNTKQVQQILHLIPKISLQYNLNQFNSFNFYGTYTSDNQDLSCLFENSILSSYRTFNGNIATINNLENLRGTISYSYKNINKGTFIILSYFHSVQLKSNVSKVSFTQDFDFYVNKFVEFSQVTNNIYTKFDKYLYSIKSAFSFKSSFFWYMNPIEVNNQVLSNRNLNYNLYLSFRPTIIENLNLNFGLDYRNNLYIESKKNSYQWNPFIDLMAVASKRISLGIKSNYFKSNYDLNKRDYYFINLNIWYSVIPKKLEGKFSILNLLNQNIVYYSTRNDILSQFKTTQILPRFALFELNYRF
jgi:hypothetical protein